MTGMPPAGTLPKATLKKLDLSGTKFTSPPDVTSLTHLLQLKVR